MHGFKTTFFILFFSIPFFVLGQKERNNLVRYSAGIIRTELNDEFDNSIIYESVDFKPFDISAELNSRRWKHRFGFYYLENTLHPLYKSSLYEFNSVVNKSGKFSYDVIYEFFISERGQIRIFGGAGIIGFGSNRERASMLKMFPYDDHVSSYDVNSGSFQLVVHPVYRIKKHEISMTVSTGLMSVVIRPENYNPLFNYSDEWKLTGLRKHFNFRGEMDYTYSISNRFALQAGYHYFFYRYSFPYPLKVLSQNYQGGVVFRF